MNITLSADADLVRKARAVARRQGKSLNQMVRDYMQSICEMEEGHQASSSVIRLMDEGGGDMKGQRFDRNEIHER